MFYRQKLILGLIQVFGGQLDNIDFQKYLFLYKSICYTKDKQFFDFVPYKYGCFSFQSYEDIRNLRESSLIESSKMALKDKNIDFLSSLTKDDQKKLSYFKKQFGDKKGNDLVRYVYERYPYYTINSEIFDKIIPNGERFTIKDKDTEELFTIGYEGKSIDSYINDLIKNNVKLVCDVRKNPLSRKYGFSQKTLSALLKAVNIDYVHIPELGIESDKRGNLNTQSDYDKLFDEYEKTTLLHADKFLTQILDLLKKYKRLALTCFEKEPSMCHRTRVANALVRKDRMLKLEHI